MSMKFLAGSFTAVLLFLCASARPPKASRLYVAQYENVLGTSMELKIMATSPEESEKAEAAVLQEISRLSGILSGYDAHSEFSRWMATNDKPVHISAALYDVLSLFDQWRDRTSGALDASAEAVTRCWKTAAAKGRVPTDEEIKAAVAEVRQPHWVLDPATHTATHLDNAPLMLNSFTKSYIIKHAADAALATAQVDAIVVNIGGDLLVSGKHREEIQVSDPRADAENDLPLDQIRVSNRAVATSGNYRRGEMIQGKWYSHIVDPRTGQPADGILSATVVAPSATDAGALATAFNVMRPEESVKLAAGMPGVDYLILTRDGRSIKSPGWGLLETGAAQTQRNDGNEMLISLAINVQKEGFAKRPYVAVWVEDENHAPVRTISIWHGSDRYLPELKSWYLKYRDRYYADKSFSASLTSATRSAGKYTLKWDGKDDHGNLVAAGKYIVKIEAAREHGTYQLMRQEIQWDGTAQKYTLAGNVEIADATLACKPQ
jgi:thiamine biosynthesis lipoprotein ApbE